MKCSNLYCLHYVLNTHPLADWNDTCCGMFEIDPYDEKDNPDGFNISDCIAKKRYDGKTGIFMLDYKSMKSGDTFFIPQIKNTKSCKTVYRNVKKIGFVAVLKKVVENNVPGIKIVITQGKK